MNVHGSLLPAYLVKRLKRLFRLARPTSQAPLADPTMTGIYCTLFASLACGASAFVAPSTMFGTGLIGLRRAHSASGLMSSRRLLSRGGATSSAATPLSMTGEHYDYLVIGGGSGGVASARRAATYDAKVPVSTLGLGEHRSRLPLCRTPPHMS